MNDNLFEFLNGPSEDDKCCWRQSDSSPVGETWWSRDPHCKLLHVRHRWLSSVPLHAWPSQSPARPWNLPGERGDRGQRTSSVCRGPRWSCRCWCWRQSPWTVWSKSLGVRGREFRQTWRVLSPERETGHLLWYSTVQYSTVQYRIVHLSWLKCFPHWLKLSRSSVQSPPPHKCEPTPWLRERFIYVLLC